MVWVSTVLEENGRLIVVSSVVVVCVEGRGSSTVVQLERRRMPPRLRNEIIMVFMDLDLGCYLSVVVVFVFFSSVVVDPGGLTMMVLFSTFSSFAGGFTMVVLFFSTVFSAGRGVMRASQPARRIAARAGIICFFMVVSVAVFEVREASGKDTRPGW